MDCNRSFCSDSMSNTEKMDCWFSLSGSRLSSPFSLSPSTRSVKFHSFHNRTMDVVSYTDKAAFAWSCRPIYFTTSGNNKVGWVQFSWRVHCITSWYLCKTQKAWYTPTLIWSYVKNNAQKTRLYPWQAPTSFRCCHVAVIFVWSIRVHIRRMVLYLYTSANQLTTF